MFRKVVMLLPLVLAAGCVSKGRFNELQQAYDDQSATLQDREQRIVTLEQALAAEEQKSAQLQKQIEGLSRDQANLLKDRASLAASVEEMLSLIHI